MPIIATHFSPVPTALLRDPSISLQAKSLYALIRSYADFGQPEGAHPSQERLCEDCGITVATLRRLRKELKTVGWLTWKLLKTAKGDVQRTDYWCNDLPHGSRRQRGEVPSPMTGGVPSPMTSNRESLDRESLTESATPAAWVRSLGEDWANTYGGIPGYGEIGKRLKPLVDLHGFEPVQEHWRNYLAATEGQFASATRFAQTYGSWDRAGGAPAQEGYVSPEDARVAFRTAGIPDNWAINPDGYDSQEALKLAILARLAKLNGALV